MPTDSLTTQQILAPFRAEIDALDDRIVDLLTTRFGIIRRVAKVKEQHGIHPTLADRVQQVKDRVAARATASGLDPELVVRLYTILIDEACALEHRLIEEATGTKLPPAP